MKWIKAMVAEVRVFLAGAAMIAGTYILLINAPGYCRYLTMENIAAVIGAIVTGVCASIVLGVVIAAALKLRAHRNRRKIRYCHRNIADRNARCLGYPDAESVCRAARRNRQ